MAVNRIINIQLATLGECIKNNNLEALAFAVLIKQKFVSSSLHYSKKRWNKTNTRALCKMFKISQSKLQQVTSNGLKLGLLRKDNDCIIANPLREYNTLRVKIPFAKRFYTLKDVVRVLRNAWATYYISRVNFVEYKVNMHKGGVDSVKSKSEYKALKKDIAPIYDSIRGFSSNISYETIANECNITRLEAIRVINTLEAKGTITKEKNIAVKPYLPQGSLNLLNELKGQFFFNSVNKRTGELVTLVQYPNSYKVSNLVNKLIRVDKTLSK